MGSQISKRSRIWDRTIGSHYEKRLEELGKELDKKPDPELDCCNRL